MPPPTNCPANMSSQDCHYGPLHQVSTPFLWLWMKGRALLVKAVKIVHISKMARAPTAEKVPYWLCAQLDIRLQQRDRRWHCERFWTVKLADGVIEIFFIDTSPLVHEYQKVVWAENKGAAYHRSAYAFPAGLHILMQRKGDQGSQWRITVQGLTTCCRWHSGAVPRCAAERAGRPSCKVTCALENSCGTPPHPL